MQAKWLLKGVLKARNAVHDERGALMVEFAITAPFFLILMIGTFDLARLFWVKNIMQYAVQQSARHAMVNPSVSQTTLETYADNSAGTMFSGITFTADVPGTDVVGGVYYRTISANYNFNYYIPIINLSNIPLTARSRVPVNPPTS